MILQLAGAAVAAGTAAHGAFHRNSGVFGRVVRRLPTDANEIALTFDDGPNPYATPLILDALAASQTRATFFFLGRHAERWPELVRRAAVEGHQIGNHGFFHRKLHFRSAEYVRDDLTRGKRAIEAAGGGTPAFFRAPHGFRSPWVTSIARSLGEQTVGWSLGVWDSDRPGADAIAERATRQVRAGDILLLHDGDGYDPVGDRLQTAKALPMIIDALTLRGYSFSLLPR
ncbi:MAG: polysaccharide deacetylase family protein [Gemmatimonadaceae bacterium]